MYWIKEHAINDDTREANEEQSSDCVTDKWKVRRSHSQFQL